MVNAELIGVKILSPMTVNSHFTFPGGKPRAAGWHCKRQEEMRSAARQTAATTNAVGEMLRRGRGGQRGRRSTKVEGKSEWRTQKEKKLCVHVHCKTVRNKD